MLNLLGYRQQYCACREGWINERSRITFNWRQCKRTLVMHGRFLHHTISVTMPKIQCILYTIVIRSSLLNKIGYVRTTEIAYYCLNPMTRRQGSDLSDLWPQSTNDDYDNMAPQRSQNRCFQRRQQTSPHGKNHTAIQIPANENVSTMLPPCNNRTSRKKSSWLYIQEYNVRKRS